MFPLLLSLPEEEGKRKKRNTIRGIIKENAKGKGRTQPFSNNELRNPLRNSLRNHLKNFIYIYIYIVDEFFKKLPKGFSDEASKGVP